MSLRVIKGHLVSTTWGIMAERTEEMERLLTPKETRDMLRIGRTTMYKMIRNKEILARKIGRKWGIPESSLRKWLQSREGVALLKPCWEIKGCSDKERSGCVVYKDLLGCLLK